ncbi:MAG TPA: hypothetical protein VMK66_16145 [Myxococcales bacterium]|nr:hypothetical protein [Myxococcales bacterium]
MKIAAMLLAAAAATAASGAELTLGPKTLNYGVGIRVGGGYTTQAGNEGMGVPTLDVRPYIGAQVAPWLKFSGNLDLNNTDNSTIHVLDALGQFEPSELFNVWMGRFLPPSDRANLSGPYYQNAWNYPTTVNGYPSIYAGRADGAAVWGQVNHGQFKYQAGIFTVDPSVPFSQAIYAGRMVYNFLDPEPGYYNSSTYYGSKDVLALGGTIQYKKTDDPAGEKKFVGFNFDLLFEKKLIASDVLSLEGAYYNFDQGNAAANQGWSYYGLASWLFGDKLGPGRVQPMVRYQHAVPAGGGDANQTIDGGINYILDGHNARVGLAVQTTVPAVGSTYTGFQLGVQIQE